MGGVPEQPQKQKAGKKGKRVRRGIRIDMTPMVDVAFLLLIFFMTTTQFKPPEIAAVTLPKSLSEIHVPETGTIMVTVTDEGNIFLATETGRGKQVFKEDFYNDITVWRTRNPTAVVVLKGDKNADFGIVSDIMDALAESKTNRFNLMTDFKEETKGK
jgi:biopolymer transport protein ExbD